MNRGLTSTGEVTSAELGPLTLVGLCHVTDLFQGRLLKPRLEDMSCTVPVSEEVGQTSKHTEE